ncbi:SDR family NAD(P)-dependent oxidoreductase [Enterobacter ludwigii]|jgi:NAD(P)-dependent dehydrogenase (short-subunit alcohol dehydrogenase family)|uniref:SDR family NAD(P)-dependent oxidoreductase n=1 Tax=Enterobacter TaxID=547 RepID=UPI00159C4726|nr:MULTISPECIES: SDR family oxidoreductase [Enterobacter]MCM7268681.1 SDR family oxidoreductase [Enterobacter ludwigii]MDI3448689.1 SDR family oxidoreductase [Enterobacter sp. V89_11]MEA3940681.1 SDR family oxidoreductase [Enterobacter ludwigii]QLA05379.1 SDR family oxidoreductase [Enterobacter ludwigii]
MSLKNKTAVIFGGSGAIGSAAAYALAREGATVYLAARDQARLEHVANRIHAAGGSARLFVFDALDADATLPDITGIDIVVNATGFMHDQGKRLDALTLSEFRQGFDPFLAAYFNIAKAVAPRMGGERAGTLITVVAPAANMAMPGHLGHIVGCAGTEALTRALAAELGAKNIRVLCVRSHAIADAVQAGSCVGDLFAIKAQAMGISVEQFLEGAAQSTMLNRLPTLEQVADTIAFLASDAAGAITGTTVNMTAGATTI